MAPHIIPSFLADAAVGCTGNPQATANGNFSCGMVTIGALCNATCAAGYIGSPSATCLANGTYSAVTGNCSLIRECRICMLWLDDTRDKQLRTPPVVLLASSPDLAMCSSSLRDEARLCCAVRFCSVLTLSCVCLEDARHFVHKHHTL
jgi:hypothetical protein